MSVIIDIPNATYEELLKEHEECEHLWSMYSCDCFGFYISALQKEIVKRGGWPTK